MAADPIDALADEAKRFAIAAQALAQSMDIHPVAMIAGLRVLTEAAQDALAEINAR